MSVQTEGVVFSSHVFELGTFFFVHREISELEIAEEGWDLGSDHSSVISMFYSSTASNRAKSPANCCPPPLCRLANPSCLEWWEPWLFNAFYAITLSLLPTAHRGSESFGWFCSELGLSFSKPCEELRSQSADRYDIRLTMMTKIKACAWGHCYGDLRY